MQRLTRSSWRHVGPSHRPAAMAVALVLCGLLAGCGGPTGPVGATSGSGGGSGASPAGSLAAVSSPGGSTSQPADGGTIDACALVTTDEVAAKAGDTVSKTEKGATSCTWWLGSDGTSWIKLVVNPIDRPAFDLAFAQADPVDGLGDKAFSDGATLVVLKGDTILELGSEIVLSDADPAVFTRPIMEIALGRL